MASALARSLVVSVLPVEDGSGEEGGMVRERDNEDGEGEGRRRGKKGGREVERGNEDGDGEGGRRRRDGRTERDNEDEEGEDSVGDRV